MITDFCLDLPRIEEEEHMIGIIEHLERKPGSVAEQICLGLVTQFWRNSKYRGNQ